MSFPAGAPICLQRVHSAAIGAPGVIRWSRLAGRWSDVSVVKVRSPRFRLGRCLLPDREGSACRADAAGLVRITMRVCTVRFLEQLLQVAASW
jgi:hypothetical protein